MKASKKLQEFKFWTCIACQFGSKIGNKAQIFLLKLGHHVKSPFPALCKPCHEDLNVLEIQIWRRSVNSRELGLRKNLASTVLRPLIHKFLLLGYFLGLLTATVSSEFFKAAQPALLYLVPFTLFPLFLMAYLKGDLRSMWEVDFANNNYTKLPKCQVIWKQNPFHNSYRQIKDYFSIVLQLLKSKKSRESRKCYNSQFQHFSIENSLENILENNWTVSKEIYLRQTNECLVDFLT